MRSFYVFAMAAVCLLGCGGGPSANRLPVFPVHGKVTYKGQPVVGADVTFTSEENKKSAFGRTDDQGEYRLTTYSGNDGAVEGKQSVMIVKSLPPAPSAPVADTESADYVPPGYGPEPPPQPPKNEIPAKYAAPETSGLIAIVNAEGDNEVNFELKD